MQAPAAPEAAVPAAAGVGVPAVEAEAPGEDRGVETSGSGLFEASLSGADTTFDEGDSGGDGLGRGFDLNGYVRGDMFVGKVPGYSQGEIKAGYGELALQLKVSGGALADGFAEARFRYGRQGHEQKLFSDLREAYVNAYFGLVDLRLGHQIIVWGRADGFNPTNNLTPMDLRIRSPIEDDRRLGNVGARAFLNLTPVRIEGVWMPLYSPTEVPEIQTPASVAFAEPDYPAPELANGLVAGRVSLELPAVEMSVSVLRGFAPLPGLAFSGLSPADSAPEVYILRRPYKHHVVGFDFSTAIGDAFAIRGEAAYRHAPGWDRKVNAPRPDVQYVLGADRSFGPVSVVAQYIGRYTLEWERDEGLDDPDQLSRYSEWEPILRDVSRERVTQELAFRNQMLFQQLERVQHIAFLRVAWPMLNETLEVSALGTLNFSTEEWIAYPKVTYKIADNASTSVGAEIYMGPDRTLMGLVDEQMSAGYAELRYSF
jgi:hypothetical protein